MQRRPVIDGIEFARAGSSLFGTWLASDFPRLRDVLRTQAGTIAWALEGLPGVQGRPALRLRLAGALQLTCQRCLGALEFPLDIEATLLLARTQAELDAEPLDPRGLECIVAQAEMPVHQLVEDELILALPIAPRHERCAGVQAAHRGSGSPFATLRERMLGARR
jgi:uncharacterized protein